MADPLSITASIVALLQISATIVQYVHDNNGFYEDWKQIIFKVTSVTGLLYCLKDLTDREQGTESWTVTVKSLDVPSGPLEQLETALESLAGRLAPFHKGKTLQRMIAWPFQKKIQEIFGVIERQKTLCGLALQNDQL